MGPGDETIQLPVQPGTRALASWIKSRWSLSSVGTVRAASMSSPARRADGSWRRRDQHEEGRALDAMTSNAAVGTEIAETIALWARELGVQYIAWRGREWCVSTIGPAWEAISDSKDRAALGRAVNAHNDHVHIELTPEGAANVDAISRVIAAIDRGESPPPDVVADTADGSSSLTFGFGVLAALTVLVELVNAKRR